MKLNDTEVRLATFSAEVVDDDTLVFNEDANKIVVMNQTASVIWRELVNCNLTNSTIDTGMLTRLLMDEFNIPIEAYDSIYGDVETTLGDFFSASLLL